MKKPYPYDDVEIGKRLCEFREHIGLNQEKFAKSIGIKKLYLSMMENGKRPVSKIIERRLILKYKMDMDWLFNGLFEMMDENTYEFYKMMEDDHDDLIKKSKERNLDIKKHLPNDGKNTNYEDITLEKLLKLNYGKEFKDIDLFIGRMMYKETPESHIENLLNRYKSYIKELDFLIKCCSERKDDDSREFIQKDNEERTKRMEELQNTIKESNDSIDVIKHTISLIKKSGKKLEEEIKKIDDWAFYLNQNEKYLARYLLKEYKAKNLMLKNKKIK